MLTNCKFDLNFKVGGNYEILFYCIEYSRNTRHAFSTRSGRRTLRSLSYADLPEAQQQHDDETEGRFNFLLLQRLHVTPFELLELSRSERTSDC